MTVVVTGASGFLGGRLAERLAESGERVRVFARPGSDLGHLRGLPVEVAIGSLQDLPSVQRACRGARWIFHCAACSTDWAPWSTFAGANVVGAQHVATAACRERRLDRLVHVSTTDVYGYPRVPCGEDAPRRDVGLPYNRTKILAEEALWAAHARGEVPLTVMRPATIYGPRSKDFGLTMGRLLAAGQMVHIGRGRCPGGFLYVDHAVDALIAAAASPHALGRAYNLADGTAETWCDYVAALARGLGARPPRLSLPPRLAFGLAVLMEAAHRAARTRRRPLLTRHAVYLLSRSQDFPVRRAREELGFAPRVAFAQGVAATARWVQSVAAPSTGG